MKLRTKIFLTASLIILLTTITGLLLLNDRISNRIEAEISNDLIKTEALFNTLIMDRTILLSTLAGNIADLPVLKAALKTDAATILIELNEYSNSNEDVELFVVVDDQNKMVTPLMVDNPDPEIDLEESIALNIDRTISKTGFWLLNEKLFLIATSPIMIDGSIEGVLVLGDCINDEFSIILKDLTDSDISFFTEDKITASSFSDSGEIRNNLYKELISYDEDMDTRVFGENEYNLIRLFLNNENHIAKTGELTDWFESKYILSRPLSKEMEVLSYIRQVIFTLAAGIVILSFILSLAISQRITRPINCLVEGTREISEGKYDTKIDCSSSSQDSKDEISILTIAFEKMRKKLKENIEKITGLNKELLDKNVELEQAFEDLKKAQDDLVKAEKMSTVGKMASSIVHDFKSPMQVIKGMTQVLQMPNIDENKKNDMMRYIDEAVDRMNQMTMDILDYTRGKTNLNIDKVKLSSVINEILLYLSNDLQSNEFKVIRQSDFDPEVEIDIQKIKRVLENIIRNSIEAAQKDNTLELKTEQDNGFVTIEIKDNGPGIDPDILETIFEPFVTRGKSQGTGLGLSIAKKLIEDHNGRISLDTEPGVGTAFIIHLPYVS